jgi:hypothetical protein
MSRQDAEIVKKIKMESATSRTDTHYTFASLRFCVERVGL